MIAFNKGDGSFIEKETRWNHRSIMNVKKFVTLSFAILFIFFSSFSFAQSESDSIVIYGDSRYGHEVHKEIVDEIVAIKPGAVFHTGDYVTDGSNLKEWAIFDEIISRLFVGHRIEFYPVRGNHDGDAESFADHFKLSDGKTWYSVEKYGIHFVVLDSNSNMSVGSAQYEWLAMDLGSVGENCRYTAVLLHHPIFNSRAGGHKEDERRLGPTLIPLFERYNVDIVFSGHIHAYERLFSDGIYFINTGGGGAPLYSPVKKSAKSQKYITKHNFLRLTPDDDRLILEAFDIDLNLIDRFVIEWKRKGF